MNFTSCTRTALWNHEFLLDKLSAITTELCNNHLTCARIGC
jgi:hypothetical protein